MSDFLDSLVARGTGGGDLVRPRPLSAFEPLPGTSRPPAIRAELDIGEQPTFAAEPPPEQEPAPAARPARKARPPAAELPRPALTVSDPAEDGTPRRARTPPREVSLPTTAGAAPRPPRRSSAPPPPGEVALPVRAGAPAPGLAGCKARPATLPPADLPPAGQAPARPARPGPPPAATMPSRGDALEPSVSSQPTTSSAPPSRTELPTSVLNPQPAEVRTVIERIVEASPQILPTQPLETSGPPRERPAPATAPPEPTIQVTIGRIEVRAAPAVAAPQAKAGRPAPMMTLEDYLRQRRGGQR